MKKPFGKIEFDFLVEIEIHTDNHANVQVQHVVGSFNWDTDIESGKIQEWLQFDNIMFEDFPLLRDQIKVKLREGINEGWL